MSSGKTVRSTTLALSYTWGTHGIGEQIGILGTSVILSCARYEGSCGIMNFGSQLKV